MNERVMGAAVGVTQVVGEGCIIACDGFLLGETPSL